MNVIDIIIILVVIYALFEGFRDGLIVQACSIVVIAISIWCGARYGDLVASTLQISGEYSAVWGFVIAVILAIIAVSVGARIAKKVLHLAGLGPLDRLLGMLISLAKNLLIMSVLLSAFGFVNSNIKMVSNDTLSKSKFYQPIVNITNWATPAWDWTLEQLEIEQKG